MSTDDATNQLLEELADAKTWATKFKQQVDGDVDVGELVREADKKIGQLEKRAKEAMKRLGCVSPETRSVYHGMADMLISWQTFKDSLK